MAEWQPIETAPKKDRWALLDLWIVDPNGQKWREPDCRYDPNNDSWIGADGRWVQGCTSRDDEGEEFFYPADKSAKATKATHWMIVLAPLMPRQPGEER